MSQQELIKSGITIDQIRDDLRNLMGIEKNYTPIPKSRTHLSKYLPKSPDELPTRSMADSYMTAIIPLAENTDLREKYVTFLDGIRVGRILEDMDIFAVVVAMRYIVNPLVPAGESNPYTLVTAAVDQIDFTSENISKTKDIRLSGHVTYVGRSSMEVMVWVDQYRNKEWHNINKSLFLLAARDPAATKAAIVNTLKPASEQEEAIFKGGVIRRKLRQQWQAQHVSKVIPTEEEQQILHELYIKSIPSDVNINKKFVPSGYVSMESASMSNLVFCQPQDRNFHNRVFGGFLMRHAIELARVNCYIYTKHRPKIRNITDIAFNKPIPVNSLLRMQSYIAYTAVNFVQITLYAETLDAMSGESVTTNALHFTFEAQTVVPKIIPITYHEHMMYIDARRRFLITLESEGLKNLIPIPDPGIKP